MLPHNLHGRARDARHDTRPVAGHGVRSIGMQPRGLCRSEGRCMAVAAARTGPLVPMSFFVGAVPCQHAPANTHQNAVGRQRTPANPLTTPSPTYSAPPSPRNVLCFRDMAVSDTFLCVCLTGFCTSHSRIASCNTQMHGPPTNPHPPPSPTCSHTLTGCPAMGTSFRQRAPANTHPTKPHPPPSPTCNHTLTGCPAMGTVGVMRLRTTKPPRDLHTTCVPG